MTTPPAKRSRASQEQLSQMVDFMYDNPGFTGGKSLKFYGKIERDRIWSELAEVLNSLGGAVKTFEQWQVVWRDLKSRTSSKVRAKKGHKTLDRNHSSYHEPLTDLEKRVIAVIGRDYIESHDSEKDLEYEEEVCSEMSSTSANIPDTYESSQPTIKRLHVEGDFTQPSASVNTAETNESAQRGIKRPQTDDSFTLQKSFLEIAGKQADALKTLAESNAASAEIARKQATALKMLAECNAANVEMAESMTKSIKSMTDALDNLANAINRISGNLTKFAGKRERLEPEMNEELNSLRTECVNNINNIFEEYEELEERSHHIPITVKSEHDEINEGQ